MARKVKEQEQIEQLNELLPTKTRTTYKVTSRIRANIMNHIINAEPGDEVLLDEFEYSILKGYVK